MSQQVYIKDGKFAGSIEVEPGQKCLHKNSKSTGGECSSGCCDEYECLDCGKTFMVEVPD